MTDRSSYLSLLASVKTALQDEEIRYRQENLSIAALDLLPKLFMLLACALDELAKADELLPFVPRHKMSPPETPSLLKSSHQVDQLWIVPKLGVDNFDVLGVSLHEEILQIVETSLNVGAELSNSDTLARTYLSTDVISND